MGLTIANLKYQDTDSSLMTYIRNTYSWLSGVSIMDGVAGKSTVGDISISGALLKAADCVLDDMPTTLTAKEIELNYYSLSFPISHCDLRQTWLSAFANEFEKVQNVYIDSLIPYLSEQIGDEVHQQFHADIIAEAEADDEVEKILLLGNVLTPQATFDTILEFIGLLPNEFIKDALDKHGRVDYGIELSVQAYKLLSMHLSSKHGSSDTNVGGFEISANKTLAGSRMIAKSFKNDLLVIDNSLELGKVSVIEKEWENRSYIKTGIAFKGSYVDSKKIVISN